MPAPDRKLLNDCFLHDRDRLRHDAALEILKANLGGVCATETVPLDAAHGRILAETISASRDIPSTDNSAVDGYAYSAADYEDTGGYFPIVARIAAGDTGAIEIPKHASARIFTGAVMPKGVDTIAMQEDCEPHEQDGGQYVAIPPGLKPGANRRRKGEDLELGDTIAKPGLRLDAQSVAAIASTGRGQIAVFKPLRVALLSSGEELLEPGVDAVAGQVYDSNRHLLKSLLKTLPVDITDLGIQPDNFETLTSVLKDAAGKHDVILSSGGASRGEEDHIITALDALGKRHLWQMAIKPGRPMTFGQINDTVFFGLPGNPVACFVCYLLYVRPSLTRLGGGHWHEPQRFLIPSGFDVPMKKPDRREFWRGMIQQNTDGETVLEKFARDGSGLITGLREADGLIEIAEEITSVAKGDMLDFIPWSEFGIFTLIRCAFPNRFFQPKLEMELNGRNRIWPVQSPCRYGW